MKGMKGMKSKKQYYHKVFALICILAAAVIIFCSVSSVQADEESGKRYKYYTSVYVDRDDTLWDIASEYISDEYEDIRAYMDEVKSINHLTGDELQYGTTICVPYYSDEYK